ncbi:hypothetical protein PFICI_10646 [Pestalotiopsis fici W106-1]|uniref:tyrosinase n=1 Tax=Pestalotiopsis fici (strain W106-1 / CGMCC3.15140) TaxID=1229662 RepID=W3WXR4_PESFW|nr:uncharacterized protein PFICI_10646 [Pestalotiopsis fici W106-1]ETS78584.1 hypothetical protein PFICI_10646 [Pestalotiopsis fici W106-1]
MSDGTNGPVIINGIKPDDSAKPPARLEVRDMIKNQPDQWNLYLLGLERFQNSVAENAPLSYFQISGIHGFPYTKWPDRDWNTMKPVSGSRGFGGFCTHSSILFLPWHRPYLALFEAELYKHVNAVANSFSDAERKADYVKAAKTFRMPYWDWARPDLPVFPAEAGIDANNQVARPKTSAEAPIKPNPLASYTFRESASDDNINWFPDVNATVRFPSQGSDTPDEQAMKQQLSAFFQGQQSSPKGRNLTERVLYILQSYTNFGAASNNRFDSQSITPGFEGWGSIEDIHNAIHNYVGGGGQMASPPVAAFDPIFWLHHTNVDRLFAIWQALHDDPGNTATYVTPRPAAEGNFYTRAGSTESAATPLMPFVEFPGGSPTSGGTFWTSEGVRSTKTFGYVYPETQDWLFPRREDIAQELRRLYQSASLANILASTGAAFDASVKNLKTRAEAHVAATVKAPAIAKPSASPEITIQTEQVPEQVPVAATPPPAAASSTPSKPQEDRDIKKLVGNDHKYLEWLVNIRAEKAELDGNYVVHVFLGDPDDAAPMLYPTNHGHVGVVATFGQDADTACENCQKGRAEGLRITGQVPLTIALAERYLAGLLDSLRPEHVVPYLQTHLHWRVTLADGRRRSRGELNHLLVSVVTCEATVPDSADGWVRYADTVVPRPEATTNRTGGGRGSGTGYVGGGVAQ